MRMAYMDNIKHYPSIKTRVAIKDNIDTVTIKESTLDEISPVQKEKMIADFYSLMLPYFNNDRATLINWMNKEIADYMYTGSISIDEICAENIREMPELIYMPKNFVAALKERAKSMGIETSIGKTGRTIELEPSTIELITTEDFQKDAAKYMNKMRNDSTMEECDLIRHINIRVSNNNDNILMKSIQIITCSDDFNENGLREQVISKLQNYRFIAYNLFGHDIKFILNRGCIEGHLIKKQHRPVQSRINVKDVYSKSLAKLNYFKLVLELIYRYKFGEMKPVEYQGQILPLYISSLLADEKFIEAYTELKGMVLRAKYILEDIRIVPNMNAKSGISKVDVLIEQKRHIIDLDKILDYCEKGEGWRRIDNNKNASVGFVSDLVNTYKFVVNNGDVRNKVLKEEARIIDLIAFKEFEKLMA